MSEVYRGVTSPLNYAIPADRNNPCYAVNLSVLTSVPVEQTHNALVAARISESNGATMPLHEAETFSIGRSTIEIQPAPGFFSVARAMDYIAAGFDTNAATIAMVRLDQEEGKYDGHYIVVPGRFEEKNMPTRYLVGDSLQSGVQDRVRPGALEARLADALEHLDIIYAQHVTVR